MTVDTVATLIHLPQPISFDRIAAWPICSSLSFSILTTRSLLCLRRYSWMQIVSVTPFAVCFARQVRFCRCLVRGRVRGCETKGRGRLGEERK